MNRQALDRNSLSLVKLLAALQVLYGHVLAHLRLARPEIGMIHTILCFFRGVPIFFILSGFLIWFSIGRPSGAKAYYKKRFWRIYPELWLAVLVEILSLVLLYRGWEWKSLLLFTFTQGTFLQFWTPDSLRGYGCGTPNGNLWTICVTVQFYLAAWFAYRAMHKKGPALWILSLIGLLGISLAGSWIAGKTGNEILVKLYGQTIFRYGWLFWFGCLLAEHREKLLPILSRFWYVFLLIGFALYYFRLDFAVGYALAQSLLGVSGLIGFAYRYPGLAVKPDLSYGIFLYQMIVMNAFIRFGWMGSWWYALAVLGLSVLFAWLSSLTIGRWAAGKRSGA